MVVTVILNLLEKERNQALRVMKTQIQQKFVIQVTVLYPIHTN